MIANDFLRNSINSSLIERLPKDFKNLIKDFEGRERDIVLTSSLGVLSCCLPNVSGVYNGDEIYPHLYVVIIAPPASGKGKMNYSRLLIDKINSKILSTSKAENQECQKKNNRENKYEICPPIRTKIFPANASSSVMYSSLSNSKHGLLIFESEADTLGQMLKNDWSNYSDVLRKVFHHESISIARKTDNICDEITCPKLSMVLSGTPEQLMPLIQSRENGLFSRLMIYSFDEVSEFKDVFAPSNTKSKERFKEFGKEIYNFYDFLKDLDGQVRFSFTPEQKRKFNLRMKSYHSDVVNNHSSHFISNFTRHALIVFRIAMILTAIRNRKKILDGETAIVCSDVDFISSMHLTSTLLSHSYYTFSTLDNGFLSIQEENILDDLNAVFERKEAIEVGNKFNIPKRTIDDKLSKWQKKRIVKKIKQGVYKKL